MKLSIARKLRVSFLFLTALFLAAAILLYFQITKVENHASSLLSVDLPTVDASRSIQQNAEFSVSSLRAYMLAADETRQAKYRQQLDDAFVKVDAELVRLQSHVTQAQFEQVKADWNTLKTSALAVAELSHQPENLPAHHQLQFEAAPLAEVALDQLQGMINEEEGNPEGEGRKRLMKLYTDAYTTLSNGLGELRAFLINANQDNLDKFEEYMRAHNRAVSEIERKKENLTESQQGLWSLFKEMQDLYLPMATDVVMQRQAQDWNKAIYLMETETLLAVEQLAQTIEAVVREQQAVAVQSGEAIGSSVQKVVILLIAISAIASLCSFVIGTWLGRDIGSRLGRVVQRAEQISHGDFSAKAMENKGSDEIASLIEAVNRMSVSLSGLVTGVSDKAQAVNASMDKLLVTNTDTAGEVTEQASRISSVATAIEEMTATAHETAQNTQLASEDLTHSASLLANGEQALMRNHQTVSELNTLVAQASEMVLQLSADSDRIEHVTEVIQGVAEQTNLLALNAAIEAARAGEQGRGFAVVADEVRLLAQRTTDSTTEINAIVDAIQSSTQHVVKVIAQSQSLVKVGTEHTVTATDMLKDSVRYMEEVSQKVSDIAVATEQQSNVSQSVAELVHQLSSSADEVSGNCSVANQTSQSIKSQVDDLNHAMKQFTV
ncbi:methyl-accepting chemotaxis protein [Photobacterium galatheae]|uniref:Chemotaxis protein n=1 Tax=Photobacterium galatheae TaxID=1654360 RepID=A0A066RKJ7_9GAMM|nr:methyl-accepting chemotaxis protein [Photobacterium galatheae]KDM89626.1 chemotaxis protein [Photobacterium galatheae]MCM0151602.1 methyl-accepting chemotaxis protein [Photobacterium galatheae]